VEFKHSFATTQEASGGGGREQRGEEGPKTWGEIKILGGDEGRDQVTRPEGRSSERTGLIRRVRDREGSLEKKQKQRGMKERKGKHGLLQQRRLCFIGGEPGASA